jgi:enoyl-CoA hydratase/carnithine racemase
MSETLILEKQGPVATITFNRPDKANAMDIRWLAPMTDFLRAVEHDARFGALIRATAST